MATDVYQIITARIVEQLENGTVPWRRPWSAGRLPQNLVSRREYRGVNVFLLSSQHYESPYWLTFRQAQQLRGNVRKGEKATPVVFWRWYEKEDAETAKKDSVPVLRYYSVFNAAQCDLPDGTVPETVPVTPPFEPIERCVAVVNAMPQRPAIELKVLSVRQPHADDIIYGSKWAENRTWKTAYRGDLYIHASRWEGRPVPTPGHGLVGAIIGKVRLVDVVDLDTVDNPTEEFRLVCRIAKQHGLPRKRENLEHVHGPICFLLADPEPLPVPILTGGKLNLWTFRLE